MIKLNDKIIEFEEFPNGERNVKLDFFNDLNLIANDTYNIELIYENDLDIINLFMVKKHMDNLYKNKKCNLLLKYIPYSRMDRTENKFIFTLKYFIELINSLNFDKVVVYDAHSDVSLALLNNVKHISIIENELENVINIGLKNKKNPLYVVIPDLGASKRYKSIFNIVEHTNAQGVIVMDKVRDFNTGQIKNIVPVNKEIIKDNKFDILIVDDLCSFGGTFVGTFEKLKEYGCENANLFVSHCENNIAQGKVLDLFDTIFTTNSILNLEKIDNINKNKIKVI